MKNKLLHLFKAAAIISTVGFVLGSAIGQNTDSRTRLDRPNILLIITDDQGYGDLAVHGNPKLRTPNLDQLARESVAFQSFYV
ncbi:MAG: sulfatase-like hydrolase/transferase, partial [Terriglobia bacterium]